MKVVGVNGFGRIGRCFTRIALMDPTIDVALINDLADAKTLAHLLKYDSIHGVLNEVVSFDMTHIIVNDRKILLLNKNLIIKLLVKSNHLVHHLKKFKMDQANSNKILLSNHHSENHL